MIWLVLIVLLLTIVGYHADRQKWEAGKHALPFEGQDMSTTIKLLIAFLVAVILLGR